MTKEELVKELKKLSDEGEVWYRDYGGRYVEIDVVKIDKAGDIVLR